MARVVGFHHGALCDPYEKQANDQGFTLGEEAENLQECGFYLIRLWMENILTDGMYDKGLERLQKQLVKALKPLTKEVNQSAENNG